MVQKAMNQSMSTKLLYFDTDCISAFFWVKCEWLLDTLYPGRLVLPSETYTELSRVPRLQTQADIILSSGQMRIENIEIGTEEYSLFDNLSNPNQGQVIIGKGEAACIALARIRNGILASNNMRDIIFHIKKFKLEYKTTAIIMKEAYEAGLITDTDGNLLWSRMLARKRKLPFPTFTDFLNSL